MALQNPKGKRTSRKIRVIPLEVLESEQFKMLSGNAVKVLLCLVKQCWQVHDKGTGNNGNLSAPKSAAAEHGLSVGSWEKGKKELLDKGFIEISRRGTSRQCHLYALTFFAIDECRKPKLDIAPTHTFSDDWKNIAPYRYTGRQT
ncbi:hypothetical protein [Neisseria perflava]|uniref:hypothetical protein n=1 Tax=Neisseria perflava TaxID=33053 RepID=UPI0020A1B937|nr:hypothetical protein [Neisseria perflava]MCP1659105.1 hypothetical protein [Neisseria perflava]